MPELNVPHAPRAVIAMSGGVDSSVAAYLMRQAGCDCIGAMMKLYENETAGIPQGHTCCSLSDAEDARAVAARLEMPFYVFNFTAEFEREVIARFVAAYRAGRTPNPCIDCNRYLKFDRLYRRTRELGRDLLATGHYARVEQSPGGRWLLKKAIDPAKDQSYVLYSLTQEQLAHTRFPLGGMTKAETREIAREQGFLNAQKHDSQDICFVPEGDYTAFLRRYTGTDPAPGNFIDPAGQVLGRHRGIEHYTVGQHKGLGLVSETPLYVQQVSARENTVTLAPAAALFCDTLTADSLNLIACDRLPGPVRLTARIRYHQPEQPATVTQLDADTVRVVFDAPQRAITPGQAVVFYEGDTVVGGAVIR